MQCAPAEAGHQGHCVVTAFDPWAPPPPVVSRPRPGAREWWTPDVAAIGTLALTLLLVGTCVAAAGSVTAAPSTSASPGPQSPAELQRALDQRVPALQAFVERERGLEFARPVDVEVLGDDDFADALLEGEDEGSGDVDQDIAATLLALRLLDPEEDLGDLTEDSYEDVVGFYDSSDERLVVRGIEVDPYVEMVIVHELTHALQDQVFDLDRPGLDEPGDERGVAFTTLVEGDAVRVENAWRADQSEQVQDQLTAEEERRFGDRDEQDITVVDVLFGFPYFAGEPYVEQVLERGGQPALDEAFRNPPTSTEQVLHPGSPAPVPPPAPDVPARDRVDAGVLGEQGLALMLGVDPREDGPQVGWAGDRYVTAEEGDGYCTRATVVMDTPGDRDELVDALREVGYDDVQPVGERDLALRSCLS